MNNKVVINTGNKTDSKIKKQQDTKKNNYSLRNKIYMFICLKHLFPTSIFKFFYDLSQITTQQVKKKQLFILDNKFEETGEQQSVSTIKDHKEHQPETSFVEPCQI